MSLYIDADAPSERWKFLDPDTCSEGALKKAYIRAAPMRRGIIYVYRENVYHDHPSLLSVKIATVL